MRAEARRQAQKPVAGSGSVALVSLAVAALSRMECGSAALAADPAGVP
ncbi:MAG: hypothetical protein ACK4RK_21975 [Gemmataceae bacterium]